MGSRPEGHGKGHIGNEGHGRSKHEPGQDVVLQLLLILSFPEMHIILRSILEVLVFKKQCSCK